MKNRIISLFLAFFFVISLSGIAMADLHNVEDMTEEDYKDAMSRSTPDMVAFTNPDGSFKEVRYFVKSTGSDSGIRYRTKNFTFQVGQCGPAIFGAHELIKTPPKPGQAQYSRVTMSREFFAALLGSVSGGPEPVRKALDTESYLIVGAEIEIYNAATGQILATIYSPDECQSKAGAIGFGAADIADMKTRWQNVPLRKGESPDFFPTPEGSSEYKEEYKTCAKTYEGKKGEPITFPVTLHNVGAKAITDFRAVWEGDGQDPVTGWQGTNPPWQSEAVELAKGESKTFEVTVTVPEHPRRLYFKANIDGSTPATEVNQDNNLMAIGIIPDGIDVGIIMPRDFSRTVKPGEKAEVTISTEIRKHDFSPLAEVETVFTYPGGSKTEQTTLYRNEHGEKSSEFYDFEYYLSPGTYKFTGQVNLLNGIDINPSNNYGETTVTIYQEKDYSAEKLNPDRETRVNLRD